LRDQPAAIANLHFTFMQHEEVAPQNWLLPKLLSSAEALQITNIPRPIGLGVSPAYRPQAVVGSEMGRRGGIPSSMESVPAPFGDEVNDDPPTRDDAKFVGLTPVQVGSETMRTRSGLPRLEEMEALADEIDALEKAGDRESLKEQAARLRERMCELQDMLDQTAYQWQTVQQKVRTTEVEQADATMSDGGMQYAQNDAWLLDGIMAIRKMNAEVLPLLAGIRERRFFRYFAVDLLASCMYMPTTEDPCGLDTCDVEPVMDVPPEIEERDFQESNFELDNWARWDQPSDFTEYYDLVENAEGNTGYNGSAVWKFIHEQIAFQQEVDLPGNKWKSDFNRAVSGLHAQVSAQIIADIEQEDPEQALQEFRRRLRDQPAAIANLHFTFMLTLNAIKACQDRLDNCGYVGEGPEFKESILALTSHPLLNDPSVMRAGEKLKKHTDSPFSTAWKLRLRTRDLVRVMNCVQCNACRLHGKVSSLGLAASLNVLLGIQGRGDSCDRPADPSSLRRHEVAAMVTFASKLSDACELVARFQMMDAIGPPR
jgi:hypothetical protein